MSCESLKKVCKIYNGNSINSDFKKNNFAGLKEGYPFIATKDVSFSGDIDYNNGVRIPFDTNYKVAPAGSVLICAEGGSAGRKIARVNQPVCFGNKLFCLIPSDKLNTDFLYYYLLSERFQSQFKFLMSGLIGGVSAKKFSSITIEYPSIKEQQSVVAGLTNTFSKIDAMQRNAEIAVNEANHFMLAAIRDMLSFKEGWNESTLDHLSIISGEYGLAASAKPYDGQTRYLRITDITEWGDLNNDVVSAELKEDVKQEKLIDGDILFARTGATVGKTLVYDSSFGSCIFAGYLIRYRLNPQLVIPRFIYYYTHSAAYYDWVVSNQRVAAQPNINAKMFGSIVISYPTVEEQKTIIKQLDNIYEHFVKIKQNYDSVCTECNKLKLAILKSYFE